MVDTLSVVAFSKLLSGQSDHHALDPLLTKDRVLGGLERLGVVVVDSIESGGNGGLLGEKGGGFGDGHCAGGVFVINGRTWVVDGVDRRAMSVSGGKAGAVMML